MAPAKRRKTKPRMRPIHLQYPGTNMNIIVCAWLCLYVGALLVVRRVWCVEPLLLERDACLTDQVGLVLPHLDIEGVGLRGIGGLQVEG